MTNLEDILEPFEKMVSIEINGKSVLVPENNWLLRCFQFLKLKQISMGEFCWNGDCANCQVWLVTDKGEKPVLSCRTKVKEGMKIVRMSEELTHAFSRSDAE